MGFSLVNAEIICKNKILDNLVEYLKFDLN